MGKRAMYLNSFYISRLYYVLWTDIDRVYKLVAMSKGGFTGMGPFGAMSYLVVKLRDGRTKKCLFKYEQQADEAISWIVDHHPEIGIHSEQAQAKLQEAQEKERTRYRQDLTGQAKVNLRILEEAKQYLEKKPQLYRNLTRCAGNKRVQDQVKTSKRVLGTGIMLGSVLLFAAGVPLTMQKTPFGIYMCMFGAAFFMFSLAGNLVPIGRNSPKRLNREWNEAVELCAQYTGKRDSFPVPPRYAHPVVLERMSRVIREGRTDRLDEALELVKDDLRALNKSVKVSQAEYDETVAVKPMFLVSDYK